MFEGKFDYENIIFEEKVVDKTKGKKEGQLFLTDVRVVFCEKKGMFGGGGISKELALTEIKSVSAEHGKKLSTLMISTDDGTYTFVVADPRWESEIMKAADISPEVSEVDGDFYKINFMQIEEKMLGKKFASIKGELFIRQTELMITIPDSGVKTLSRNTSLIKNRTVPQNKIRNVKFDKVAVASSKWILIDYMGQKWMETIGILGENAEKSNEIVQEIYKMWDPSKTPPVIHVQAGETVAGKIKGISGKVLGKIKGKTCPSCGTQAGKSDKFCIGCGSTLEEEKVGKSECSNCGAELKPRIKFCGGCGEEVKERSPFCSNCGAELEPGIKFCGGCGTKAE